MQRTVRRWLGRATFAAFSIFFAFPSIAQNRFFAGKTIRIIVGFPAGSGFDAYSRVIARHMGKHLPGSPTVSVENMAGAGSGAASGSTRASIGGGAASGRTGSIGGVLHAQRKRTRSRTGKNLPLADICPGSHPQAIDARQRTPVEP